MRHEITLTLAMAACGEIASQTPDARVTDAEALDAAGDTVRPACDVTKPFGTPTNVAELNTTGIDAYAWPSQDLLTVYVANQAMGSSDRNILIATRTQPSGPYTGIKPLPGGVNTAGFEDHPAVTADGLTLFLESTATGGGDIHVTSRSSTAADFPAASMVAVVNDATYAEGNPWISADGLTLYFNSQRVSMQEDLYRATRATTSAQFGAPTAIGELNTVQNDISAVLSPDGLTIYFGSQRAGSGNHDLWRASRSTTANGFGTPVMVSELSSNATDEFPSWISADDCTLLFSSNRDGGLGMHDIWTASRPPI